MNCINLKFVYTMNLERIILAETVLPRDDAYHNSTSTSVKKPYIIYYSTIDLYTAPFNYSIYGKQYLGDTVKVTATLALYTPHYNHSGHFPCSVGGIP